MTAEPLFPQASRAGAGRRGAEGIVVGPARGSRSAFAGAGEGEIVLVSRGRRGSAPKVLRRIGRPEIARDAIEALMLDRGVRRNFGRAVEEEAKQAGARVIANTEGRRDLITLPTFTIDPLSARDFDDAISAEAIEGERVRVWVHIADVAAHVREGSKLDREARRRSTSVYAPGTVEPMLPHALSSEACSLRPGEVRAAVTVELELNGAQVVKAAFYRSLIRSDERLDYERVDRIFAGSERAAEPWATPLAVARGAAAALGERREAAGALVVDSAEPEFSFDEHGDVQEVQGRAADRVAPPDRAPDGGRERGRGEDALRARRALPLPRARAARARTNRAPRRTARLTRGGHAAGARSDVALAGRRAAGRDLGEGGRARGARGGRGRIALGSLILRSLKQAYYSPVNLGHAGLHSTAYCHFTSPIRRYPDIVCHRALLASLGEGEHAPRASELAELGAWTSEREREAMVIERDSDDVAACFALEAALRRDGPGQVIEGEVAGLISAGAFLAFAAPGEEGSAPAFEGMLPVRLMRGPRPSAAARGGAGARGAPRGGRRDAPRGEDRAGEREWWELNEEGTILRGERSGATVRLGDRLRVRVASIDALRGRVDLEQAG